MENSTCDQFAETIAMEECGSMTSTFSNSSPDTEVVPSNFSKSPAEMRQSFEDAGIRFIERSIVKIGKQIGSGGQGTVYEASVSFPYEAKYAKMAVKKFKSGFGMSQVEYRLKLWKSDQDFVLRPTAMFFDDDECLCMLMPLCSGDLRRAIDIEMKKKRSGPPFGEMSAFSLIVQLALGMKGLHATGVCHRDLKADNILLMSAPISTLRVSMPIDEFDEAAKAFHIDTLHMCHIADFENSENVKGTAFWRAPEVLMSLRTRIPLTSAQWQAADVYSFGMLCYEIVTGGIPFAGKPFSDYDIVLNGGRPELPDHVPEVFRSIIIACWHPNPECRPDFGEIMGALEMSVQGHPFMSILEGWENVARVGDSKSENLYLELVELEIIVRRHYEVNGDGNRGFQNYNGGLKYLAYVEQFFDVLRKEHHVNTMLRVGDKLPLSFAYYIECQKLEVLIVHSFFEFWFTLEINDDLKQFIKNCEDHGVLYLKENARMITLARKTFKELQRLFERIDLKYNDYDLTVEEKLEAVHDLVRVVKHIRPVNAILVLIDRILKKMDLGRTDIKITMFRRHIEYELTLREQEQLIIFIYMMVECIVGTIVVDYVYQSKVYSATLKELEQFKILIYMMVEIILLYFIYQSSCCQPHLFEIFEVKISNFYDIFLEVAYPHLETSTNMLFSSFPERTRGFGQFDRVLQASCRVIDYCLCVENSHGLTKGFRQCIGWLGRQCIGWLGIQYCLQWVLYLLVIVIDEVY